MTNLILKCLIFIFATLASPAFATGSQNVALPDRIYVTTSDAHIGLVDLRRGTYKPVLRTPEVFTDIARANGKQPQFYASSASNLYFANIDGSDSEINLIGTF